MDLNINRLRNKNKREIVRHLVEYVVTTEDEFEDKETRSGSRTDLNIYLADNEDFEIGELEKWIHYLSTSDRPSGHNKQYVNAHTFYEETIGDDVSMVTISTPSKNREDEFVFIKNDGYLWILTTVHSDWRDKTIEPLLDYLPCIERLYLSSDDLENLADNLEDSRVSGFTAKYHTPHRERDATLQFSGAEDGDLEKAKDTFDATATRIDFDQTNSPATAVQGANTNDGRIALRSVVEGSQPRAVETLLGLSEEYQELDRRHFNVDHVPVMEGLRTGLSVKGFTAVELTNPDRDTAEDLAGELEEFVLNSHQYDYGFRDGGRKIRVYDSDFKEFFDVALEPPEIVLYTRESTTALSLRSFVKRVYDELDSTYSIEKVENPIAVE